MFKKIFLFMFFLILSTNDLSASEMLQKFEVEVGVFDGASLELSYAENNNKYDIKTTMKTANFFGKIYPFEGEYEAVGFLSKLKVKPISYNAKTKAGKRLRTKEIFYNKKGQAYKRISKRDGRINEVEIKDVPETSDVADLQSILAELIFQFNDTRSCKLEREVYDGKKHYKVLINDEGHENRVFKFDNKFRNSYKCSIYIENLKENNDNILWDVTAERPINLWLEMDNKLNMPKILEISIDSSPLGAVQISPINL